MDFVYTGNGVTVTGTFTVPDEDGTPTNPDTVTFSFKNGDAGVWTNWVYGVDVQVVRVSTGVYTIDLDTTDLPGRWIVIMVGTGAAEAAEQDEFDVVALANAI